MDLVALDRVRQGPNDVLLPDHIRERARTMAAIERGAGGHGLIESSGAVGTASRGADGSIFGSCTLP